MHALPSFRRTLVGVLAASCAALLAFVAAPVVAQPTSTNPLDPPANGMRRADPSWQVLTGGTIHVAPGRIIDDGFVEIRDGEIIAVGPMSQLERRRNSPLANARVMDVTGHQVYAGFIDAWAPVSAPDLEDAAPGTHWNEHVRPSRMASAGAGLSNAERKTLRAAGFTSAQIAPKDGIFRGLSAVVPLADTPSDRSLARPRPYRDQVASVIAFDRSSDTYPNSHMGVVALIRQTLLDADWLADQRRRRVSGIADSSLDVLVDRRRPVAFDIGTRELVALHAGKVAREFDREGIVVGNGMEFKWLDAVAADGLAIITPLNHPKAPDVSSVGHADSVELETMMTWEQAPTNPRRLDEAGLTVALTASKGDKDNKPAGFHKRLARSMKEGLSHDRALAMLTTNPARILAVDDRLGTIEVGKRANLTVTEHRLGHDTLAIRSVWIEGQRFEVDPPKPHGLAGRYRITNSTDPDDPAILEVNADAMSITLTPEPAQANQADAPEPQKGKLTSIEDRSFTFTLTDNDLEIIASAVVQDGRITGIARVTNDLSITFTGNRIDDDQQDDQPGDKPDDKLEKPYEPAPDLVGAPFGPYAIEPPAQEDLYIHSATIWTSGPDGIISNGAMLIRDGMIAAIVDMDRGSISLDVGGARVVDASGLHITPGIIDAHSHTGLFELGVNESGQAVTSEVRIADAVDPSHINWYRQIASGVTTVMSLHGSANPIGGQSLTQKVRWGSRHPDDMHLQGAMPGIKFALGENVKQSNWGDRFTSRYPQSRMGVETIMRDRFAAAIEYARNRRAGNARPDLELDAIAEILAGERLIHCHSYRQDEILMLCQLAEEFGFTIGTFQHGLEVYKVAEHVKKHAIGASIFSDWWAFKFEVFDAIPFAGPLQHEVGVNTSYNSDSDELVRRMNTEAAKAVRYSRGSIDPATALKFVTLNPAIQLGIADRVGSLEVGKDADFAIWNGPPLSSLSRCVATYIDGREYFSDARDAQLRERVSRERDRLITKILTQGRPAKSAGDAKESEDAPADPVGVDPGAMLARDMRSGRESLRQRLMREQLQVRVREDMLEALNTGRMPEHDNCAVCGCSDLHLLHSFMQ